MEPSFVFSNQPAWRWWRHGALLAALFVYFFVTLVTFGRGPGARVSDYDYVRLGLLDAAGRTLLTVLLLYPLLYYYLPRLFRGGPTLVLAGAVAATGLAGYGLTRYVIYPFQALIGYDAAPPTLAFGSIHALSRISFAVVLGLVVKLSKSWFLTQAARQQAEQTRTAAELQVLKAQLQPHFLFNTLNNLYAETLGKADAAAEMILKLSDVLGYVLYESHRPRVPLAAEIRLLKNYLALERLRYGDRLDLTFAVRGAINGQQVPPLLLLPLVENAFKHGASEALEARTWLRIDVDVSSDCLRLAVRNPCPPPGTPTRPSTAAAGGLGLRNLRQQLALLYGPAADLAAQRGPDDVFTADLRIPL
ncbi:sensor histidine kinase [Hymenobacter sp.]|uniref:sensor histidine kinase n=1 Tax=Hymenobacter sp. TaxID=1898978 RepID=UPI00286CFBA5|nr:sensor histidine kinase [Hymenobacter sp.]